MLLKSVSGIQVMRCLVCLKLLPDSNPEADNKRESMKAQLGIMFILRKLLEIPSNVCSLFLEEYGNPNLWIRCCDSCSVLAKKARNICDEIILLQKQFDNVQKEFKNAVAQSVKSQGIVHNNDYSNNGASGIVRSYFTTDYYRYQAHPSTPTKVNSKNVVLCDSLPNNSDNESHSSFANNDENDSAPDWQPDELDNFEDGNIIETHSEKQTSSTVQNINDVNSSIPAVNDENLNVPFENERNSKNDNSLKTADEDCAIPSVQKDGKNVLLQTATGVEDWTILSENERDGKNNSTKKTDDDKDWQLPSENENGEECEEFNTFMNNEKADKKKETKNNPHKQKLYAVRKKARSPRIRNVCRICNKTFVTSKFLLNHYQEEHNKSKLHPCHLCDKEYDELGSFKKHFMQHTGELPFTCEFCGKGFIQSGNYRRHVMVNHDGRITKVCDICGMGFIDPAALARHKRVHSTNEEDKAFKCNKCPKRFFTRGYLKLHAVSHTQEKPFKCEICDKRFGYPTGLNLHLKTAHNDSRLAQKNFHCEKCGKGFAQINHLKIHSRMHDRHREDVTCKICSKTFPMPSRLLRHMRIHTGLQPYDCSECGKKFSHKGGLVVHMRYVHTGEKPFQCDVCGKAFPTTGKVTRHKATHNKTNK